MLLLLLLTRPPSQPSHTGANETAGKPRSHKERPILPRFPAQGAAYWTGLQGNKRTATDPGPINLTPGWGNDHYPQAHHGFARSHCSSCQMDVLPQADPSLRSQLMHSYLGLGSPKELHEYEMHQQSLRQPTDNNTLQQHGHRRGEILNKFQSFASKLLLLVLPLLQPRMHACG